MPLKELRVIDHPLVQRNLRILRDKKTLSQEFRRVLAEVAALMVYEATRDFATTSRAVSTPLGPARGCVLKREVILIPVLRAGLGMLNPILELIPNARVGFIGLKREERTLVASAYHKSLPQNLKRFEILLIDPMLATGGSAVAALNLLTEHQATRMTLINLIAAPEGIRHVHQYFPRVPIVTAAVDKGLNESGFIIPGLGDAGDRLFGVTPNP